MRNLHLTVCMVYDGNPCCACPACLRRRASAHHIRGVGGNSGDSLRVDMVEVPWMDMAGVRFSQVSCPQHTMAKWLLDQNEG